MAFRRAVPFLLLVVVAATGCTASEGSSVAGTCRQDGTAKVCLESENAGAFHVWGEGFRPSTELKLDIESGAGRTIAIDAQGRFPGEGARVGFLPGPDLEQHRLEGVDASGRSVIFVVTCSLNATKHATCSF